MYGKVNVSSKEKDYEFCFNIHKSLKKEDRQIEPEFYSKWMESNHTHYDFEIISIDGKSDLLDGFHIHESKLNGKKFVCWSGQLPTEMHAMTTVNTWCVGTVYTLETGIDFQKLYDIHGLSMDEFCAMDSVLRDSYGVTAINTLYSFK
ncbi:MAG: hypothetical protein NTX85_02275 [Candidatus Nomurabacteria bacterium]|nr:hypothetical protein [Candidatus Nomurabacteria bacterium]